MLAAMQSNPTYPPSVASAANVRASRPHPQPTSSSTPPEGRCLRTIWAQASATTRKFSTLGAPAAHIKDSGGRGTTPSQRGYPAWTLSASRPVIRESDVDSRGAGTALVSIRAIDAPATPYMGGEGCIDVDKRYFLRMAGAAGLECHDEAADFVGETLLVMRTRVRVPGGASAVQGTPAAVVGGRA